MNTNRGLTGIAAGFVSYIAAYLFFIPLEYFDKIFLSLLPVFLFLTGMGIGYFIKEFKECLIFGGITGIIGIVVVFVLNFEHLSSDFIRVMSLNAIGLFFGFGFGAILYYRVARKRKINEAMNK
ncbi:MAG: hypothetical protein BWK75_00815 [Candidatus Altiarchaeales archaeon A3]|nr:MAG: hypothetical protein BWK75_00815 [Candidatus Altiarchaeales archaeon A3]